MKLSELIYFLQEKLNKHGDEKIQFLCNEGECLEIIDFINKNKSGSFQHEIWLN